MERLYQYNDKVVKLADRHEGPSSKEMFQAAMEKVKEWDITDESRARATLDLPLMMNLKCMKGIWSKRFGVK
ncbi:MAG: hypothetical protein Q9M16_05215 [Mariprofundus sp.]|nr:hypothetical protein [Mariprofundus sp.]